jgi:hypothetical protein
MDFSHSNTSKALAFQGYSNSFFTALLPNSIASEDMTSMTMGE